MKNGLNETSNCNIDNLCKILSKKNVDLFFISPSENLKYLVNIDILDCWRFQGLFITKDKSLFYIIPEFRKSEIQYSAEYGIDIFTYRENPDDAIDRAFKKYNIFDKILAVNEQCKAIDIINIIDKYKIKLINGIGIIEELTIFKSNYELEMLTIASAKTDVVYELILHYIKPNMTEGHIREKIAFFFKEMGVEEYCYGNVRFGKNTALAMYAKEEGRLEKNDIVLIELGCKYNNMYSKLARTFFVGKASKEQKRIYNTVLEANAKAEYLSKAGMMAKDVDSIARKIINMNGYGELFTHELGHGIGHCKYEAPHISESNSTKIQNGMAFTINPGIYVENDFGIRIEDIVIVQNDKLTPLNRITKEMIIL